MGDLARRKQRIAGFESEPFLSYLDNELAFNGVEPLVLIVMQVPRGAALFPERVLEDEQAVAVVRAHLEVNGADAQPPMLAESIFACPDSEGRR
jgi:hypothetical protein